MGGGAAGDASIASRPGEIDRVVFLGAAPNGPADKLKSASLFIVARDDASEDGPRLPGIRAQYDRAPQPKELIVLDGSAHAQFLFQTIQGERVMREILRFLSANRAMACRVSPIKMTRFFGGVANRGLLCRLSHGTRLVIRSSRGNPSMLIEQQIAERQERAAAELKILKWPAGGPYGDYIVKLISGDPSELIEEAGNGPASSDDVVKFLLVTRS